MSYVSQAVALETAAIDDQHTPIAISAG